MRPRLPALLLASLLALAACGGQGPSPNAGDATPAKASTSDDGGRPPALAASHLDPLARGLAAENQHLEKAVRQLQAADSDAAQGLALAEIESARLDAVGGDAAGLGAHAYRLLRDALFEHLGQIDTRVALEARYAEADTTGMDEASAAEARRVAAAVMAALPDPYADLDPALADALRQRQAELAGLRDANIALLFEAVEG